MAAGLRLGGVPMAESWPKTSRRREPAGIRAGFRVFTGITLWARIASTTTFRAQEVRHIAQAIDCLFASYFAQPIGESAAWQPAENKLRRLVACADATHPQAYRSVLLSANCTPSQYGLVRTVS